MKLTKELIFDKEFSSAHGKLA